MKVVCDPKIWQAFLRRCKRWHPKEHIEAAWGLETIESFRIVKFSRIKIDKRKTSSLEYDELEVKRQKWLAKKAGLLFLGTIHTHPRLDDDSAPSSSDHKEAHKDGERLMGILQLSRKNGRFSATVEWWFPQKSLEFVLLPYVQPQRPKSS